MSDHNSGTDKNHWGSQQQSNTHVLNTSAVEPHLKAYERRKSSMSFDDDNDEDGENVSIASYGGNSSMHSYAEDKSLLNMEAKYRALQQPATSPSAHNSPVNKAEMAKPPPPLLNLDSEANKHDPASKVSYSHDPMISEAAAEHQREQQMKDDSKPAGQSFADQTAHGTFSRPGEYEDPAVTSELRSMYQKIQKCLDMRHRYQRISVQQDSDNPKNQPEWVVYPPPPKPAWKESKEFRPEVDSNIYGSTHRPLGKKIGDDFHFEECEIPGESDMTFKMDDSGVYQVYENEDSLNHGSYPVAHIPTIREYYMDLNEIIGISSEGPSKSFAFRRLEYLEAKWNLYLLLNEYHEISDSKKTPHRDFYNVRKVDTHIHHSACMNQKHLLRFIKYKMKKSPDEVVIYRDQKLLTLNEVFESLQLSAYDLSIDTLDMHAHKDTFHRFDKFNLKYNPIGESRLREIFLKTDNYIKGRYLAELTKEVVEDLEQSKYQMAEYRISIYGRNINEWDKLAAWVVDNKLVSPNVRWLIQLPRLYDVYKNMGIIENFEQVVQNVFQPLFEVTKNPQSHPKLHILLQRVVGFDSVDDESKPDRQESKKFPTPKNWNSSQNPPYSYYLYYLYANIASLNIWRKQRGFNTFVFRPHCGEAGDPEHLVSAFLCCQGISHGILLRKVPFIQYLYYLDQIPIAMSPLSNNALFLTYDKNPFHTYFKRGMNVSLSTDDPLQFSYTREPLIEEYSVAAQIYKLSNVDMCELARNSVLQSGFESEMKRHWLGKNYTELGPEGNNMEKTNVPDVRMSYRHETLLHETGLMERYCGGVDNYNVIQDFSTLDLKQSVS